MVQASADSAWNSSLQRRSLLYEVCEAASSAGLKWWCSIICRGGVLLEVAEVQLSVTSGQYIREGGDFCLATLSGVYTQAPPSPPPAAAAPSIFPYLKISPLTRVFLKVLDLHARKGSRERSSFLIMPGTHPASIAGLNTYLLYTLW